MTSMANHTIPTGWTLISLRPQGQHAGLRQAAAKRGGATVALSPWRLQRLQGAAVEQRLNQALACPRVVFTSPAAVAAAAALQCLPSAQRGPWLTVGEGTARALHAQGIAEVNAPQRMDSEGLLGLPVLADVRGMQIGLVTAPGGRGLIAAQLQAAGAQIVRADVYQRVPLRVSRRNLARLAHSARPWLLAVSSGEALQRFWQQLPAPWQQRLSESVTVLAASDRLAAQARALGMARVVRSEGPTIAQMTAAAHGALTAPAAT
ncbi:uroporphyrinogen-III synthase [Stenotrophomonas sp. ESTM1D_MKCIP4_1]|uniref:uroporphyrinogen-III synthase n=1 Tax=Stenotrophomonas sp. ESTM1D_MKCIP4_1 TaxID=2072414 RepID=UPI000D542500|nr:uroporphyrinogen-III synthase [Stenotrophomonas sp. ESTM1D_MKCIP4_1]AWH51825.1 uroporphyrinogen-III synthase [Stenotrophomonas sp. ESTM1D_MKCIP4_1]